MFVGIYIYIYILRRKQKVRIDKLKNLLLFNNIMDLYTFFSISV